MVEFDIIEQGTLAMIGCQVVLGFSITELDTYSVPGVADDSAAIATQTAEFQIDNRSDGGSAECFKKQAISRQIMNRTRVPGAVQPQRSPIAC